MTKETDYSKYFSTITLQDTKKERAILVSEAPEELRECIRLIHKELRGDGGWPCDWIYSHVSCAFSDLSSDTDDDNLHQMVDSSIDVYTNDLLEWAKFEWARGCIASWEEDVGKSDTLESTLSGGQYYAISIIYNAVREFMKEQEEDD